SSLVALMDDMLSSTSWDGHFKNTKAIDMIPQIGRIPMICQAEKCEFAEACPLMREASLREDENEVLEEMRGKPCRVDRVETVKLFADLIKELKVEPNHTI